VAVEAAQRRKGHTNAMGWETREGGRVPYYTRTRRVGGGRVREYVGGGPAGALAAEEDAERRATKEQERAELEALRAERAGRERWLDQLDARANALLRAGLVLAGYRQHDRGEWRRQRGTSDGA
jgi:hypothetical protein